MTARADLEAVAGHRWLQTFSVVIQRNRRMGQTFPFVRASDRGLFEAAQFVPDLTGWGYRFTARSEIDDTALISAAVAVGEDPTPGDGNIATLLVDISASAMGAVTFTRPPLERTIPVRRLPYRLILIDPDGDEMELLHGWLAVRAKVAAE